MAYDTFISQPYETNTIVAAQHSVFPCNIDVRHWQLRNLISSSESNVINYVSGYKIFQLNLDSQKLTHLATLNFEPRCTASGHGYICAGGAEEGLLAILKVDSNTSDAAGVDQPLALGFAGGGEGPKSRPTVKTDQVGDSIINSIAIYKLEGNPELGIQDDVVALLTNNDKTVRILSLSAGVETAALDMAFPVNHATLSPDCQILVAVGDYQQAYFFERIPLSLAESKAQICRFASNHCTWVLLNIVNLHYPRAAGISGYFATAWSSSGKLCAVASENGYVTLLDIDKVKAGEPEEDCTVTLVSSTRPSIVPGPGAIRTLHFTPAPWELLVWSEGRGRVVVADLRNFLNTRQVIHLHSSSSKTSTINPEIVTDFPAPFLEPAMLSRGEHSYQHLRRTRDGVVLEHAPVSDRSPHSAFRRRLARLTTEETLEGINSREWEQSMEGMNPGERMILEVFRSAAARPTDSPSNRSIHYRRLRESRDARFPGGLYDISAFAGDEDSITNTSNGPQRHQTDTDRQQYQSNSTSPSASRRRQVSIVFSPDDAANTDYLSRSTLPYNESTLLRLREPLQPNATDHGPDRMAGWNRIDSFRQKLAPDDDCITSDYNLQQARQREQWLRNAYQLTRRDHQLLQVQAVRNHEDGPETAGRYTTGIIISPDGKKIWSGSTKGIFEFHLNIRSLMNYPSIEAC